MKKLDNPKRGKAISPDSLVMVRSSRRGKNAPQLYWHLYVEGKRVGKAYVQVYDDRNAAFVTVMINKNSQGQGIGTLAFRKACEESGFLEVFAEVRRGNIASQTALRRVGFTPYSRNASGEDILVWKRQ